MLIVKGRYQLIDGLWQNRSKELEGRDARVAGQEVRRADRMSRVKLRTERSLKS